jgi:hypothetical protein
MGPAGSCHPPEPGQWGIVGATPESNAAAVSRSG